LVLEQWKHIVVTMEKEIKHKEMTPLAKDERKGILDYLKKHGR